MAFYNNFQGDKSSLELIQKNIDKKTILIPGISCQTGTDLSSLGDVCYYFKRAASSLTTGKAGRPVNYINSGVTRAEFALEDSIQFGDVLPVVNAYSTVNVVEDRLGYQINEAVNLHNKLALFYLIQNGTDVQDYTDLTASNAYDKLIAVIEDFKLNNKAKALEPTAIFVSNAAAKLLLGDTRFLRFMYRPDDIKPFNNIIGKIGEAFVFEAPDMDDYPKFDFVVLNAEAFIAPMNVERSVIQPASNFGFPSGKIVAGELRYGFQIAYSGAVLVKLNKIDVQAPVIAMYEDWANDKKFNWAAITGADGYKVNINGVDQADQTDTICDLNDKLSTEEKVFYVRAYKVEAGTERSYSAASNILKAQKRETPVIELESTERIVTITNFVTGHVYSLFNEGSETPVASNISAAQFALEDYEISKANSLYVVDNEDHVAGDVKYWFRSDISNQITEEDPIDPLNFQNKSFMTCGEKADTTHCSVGAYNTETKEFANAKYSIYSCTATYSAGLETITFSGEELGKDVVFECHYVDEYSYLIEQDAKTRFEEVDYNLFENKIFKYSEELFIELGAYDGSTYGSINFQGTSGINISTDKTACTISATFDGAEKTFYFKSDRSGLYEGMPNIALYDNDEGKTYYRFI